MDELHGWIIETLTIWRTEDGGTNWQKAFSPFEQKAKGQPVRGFFVDMLRAWVCGTSGEVYSTNDGGKTWVTQTVSAKDSDFTDVFFSNEKTGWLIGFIGGRPGNVVYLTNDGGKNWRLVPVTVHQAHLESVYFLNDKEGWACGETRSDDANANTGKATLFHTGDGGQSWQPTFTKDNEPFFDRIWFVDQQNAWLSARDGLYRSNDAGKSWQLALGLPPLKEMP